MMKHITKIFFIASGVTSMAACTPPTTEPISVDLPDNAQTIIKCNAANDLSNGRVRAYGSFQHNGKNELRYTDRSGVERLKTDCYRVRIGHSKIFNKSPKIL